MSTWIDIVRTAYTLNGDLQDWLGQLAEVSMPLLDTGRGVVAVSIRVLPESVAIDALAAAGNADQAVVRASIASGSEQAFDALYRSGIPASTLSEALFPNVPDAETRFLTATKGRIRDVLGIVAYAGNGFVLSLSGALDARRCMSASERRYWTRVAAHVGAGLRLRKSLATLRLDDARVEAVLDGNGNIQHVAPGLTHGARQRLVDALERRARSQSGTLDPATSLEVWRGLVSGRWSLLDYLDTDGRRLVVAVRNDPRVRDPRGLTQREFAIAEAVGHGLSNKQAAYALGVSASSVSNALRNVSAKLQLHARADIAAFFSPGGLRARLHAIELNGQTLAAGYLPSLDEAQLDVLSEAERDVALQLLAGATNADVAARRGAAERTVANQVQSIYRKLGVRSRGELAAKLQTRTPTAAESLQPERR